MQKAQDREARRRAIGKMLSSADRALGDRLRKLKAPPPEAAKEPAPKEEEITEDDEQRLMALYEEKQAAKE